MVLYIEEYLNLIKRMKMLQISINDYTQCNINWRNIYVLKFYCMAVFQSYFDSFPLFLNIEIQFEQFLYISYGNFIVVNQYVSCQHIVNKNYIFLKTNYALAIVRWHPLTVQRHHNPPNLYSIILYSIIHAYTIGIPVKS